MYRMHIHVAKDRRDDPLKYTEGIGTISKVTMENLLAQMEENSRSNTSHLTLAPVEPGHIAVIAVSPGDGIARIFASLGAAGIVEGGQTMNPSTEDILKTFENLPTDQIIILPNNKNITLAAQSAASLTVKKVAVIPSTSVPQGLSAMLRLTPDGDFDDTVKEMTDALIDVETGEITTATRSVEMNGVSVQKGQVIALHNGKLVYSALSLDEATLGLLAHAHTTDRERITLFYGANLEKPEVNRLVDKIRSAYPMQEIEVHEGGQPHYQFILSIE
jgi:dihydroxyacetone kinase-like predicted kinase